MYLTNENGDVTPNQSPFLYVVPSIAVDCRPPNPWIAAPARRPTTSPPTSNSWTVPSSTTSKPRRSAAVAFLPPFHTSVRHGEAHDHRFPIVRFFGFRPQRRRLHELQLPCVRRSRRGVRDGERLEVPVRSDVVQRVPGMQSVDVAWEWACSVEFDVQDCVTGTSGTISKLYAQLGVGEEEK